MQETMEMIKQAYNDNVRVIIATPHYGLINLGYDGVIAKKLLAEVRKETAKLYPDMHLLMGNEIYYQQGIADDLLSGKAR